MTPADAEGVEVSVLVATRNRAHYLETCLRTLTQQECAVPFEILVIDNASEDATADVLAEWAIHDDRVRVLREDRLGRSCALNRGLRDARGRLLLFTDDDVVVEPGWIEAYREALEGAPETCLLMGGPIHPVPHDLGPWPKWLGRGAAAQVGDLDHGARARPLGPTEWAWGANMGARCELFAGLGGWDEDLGVKGDESGTYEDIELQQRVRQAGSDVWYVPGAVIQHRVPREEITPRRVLRRAFHAGLSRSTHVLHHRVRGDSGAPALLPCVAALGCWLLVWTAAATATYVYRSAGAVGVGRAAADRAGRRLGEIDFHARTRPQARTVRWLRRAAHRLSRGGVSRLAVDR